MDTPQVALICVPERAREYPFAVERFVDTEHRGALLNHLRALKWAANQDSRVIIMEDDAVPCGDFMRRAAAALARSPDDLVSLYLGRGAPIWAQPDVERAIRRADRIGARTIELRDLLHCVCYSMPSGRIPGVIDRIGEVGRSDPSDRTIGEAWAAETGRAVVYSWPSLVDHDWTLPGVHEHRGRRPTEPRRAWRTT